MDLLGSAPTKIAGAALRRPTANCRALPGAREKMFPSPKEAPEAGPASQDTEVVISALLFLAVILGVRIRL